MKILIIDDSRAMRRIVQANLRKAGFSGHEIIEASDGVEALETIKKSSPELILSDWNMPNMTGIELLQKLREEKIAIPFGFVTSEGTEAMRERAAAAGAGFYLAKPFTADDMADALESYIL